MYDSGTVIGSVHFVHYITLVSCFCEADLLLRDVLIRGAAFGRLAPMGQIGAEGGGTPVIRLHRSLGVSYPCSRRARLASPLSNIYQSLRELASALNGSLPYFEYNTGFPPSGHTSGIIMPKYASICRRGDYREIGISI